jgi:hypothetical protein
MLDPADCPRVVSTHAEKYHRQGIASSAKTGVRGEWDRKHTSAASRLRHNVPEQREEAALRTRRGQAGSCGGCRRINVSRGGDSERA